MHFQHTSSSAKVIGVVWIQVCVSHFAQMCVLLSFLFLFLFFCTRLAQQNWRCATVHALFINSSHNIWLFNSFSAVSVGYMYCLQDPQTSLFSNFFIKNGSHYTIHTFKSYFATVFSIFSKINSIQTHPYFQTWSTLRSCPKQRF